MKTIGIPEPSPSVPLVGRIFWSMCLPMAFRLFPDGLDVRDTINCEIRALSIPVSGMPTTHILTQVRAVATFPVSCRCAPLLPVNSIVFPSKRAIFFWVSPVTLAKPLSIDRRFSGPCVRNPLACLLRIFPIPRSRSQPGAFHAPAATCVAPRDMPVLAWQAREVVFLASLYSQSTGGIPHPLATPIFTGRRLIKPNRLACETAHLKAPRGASGSSMYEKQTVDTRHCLRLVRWRPSVLFP